MGSPRDISVLFATYNRAAELRRTLERMCAIDRSGLDVEFVIVDNNSRDETSEVLAEFSRRLPLRSLFEPRPGKNCALNRALDQVELGEIVLFTDDDVDPAPDLFQAIRRATDDHPDSSVFGGRVRAVWPAPVVPGWATHPGIHGWGFASLDLGEEACEFPERRFPSGPNFWVRRSVFADGRRFNEELGPRPENRIMGSETSFLKALRDAGHRILYCPRAVMGHRIEPEALTPRAIRRRAYRIGRTSPHIMGVRHSDLLARHPRRWRWARRFSLVRYLLQLGCGFLYWNRDRRTLATVAAIRGLAYNREALRLERAARRSGSKLLSRAS